MNPRLKTWLLFATGILSIALSPAAAQQRRFVGYFTEWGIYSSGRYYVPADVPADRLTHINYAFIKPIDTNADGYYECAFNDTWAARQHDFSQSRVVPGTAAGENIGLLNQLRRLRSWRQENGQILPLIFSIGASSVRDRFSAIASNATHRQRFVDSCIQLLQQESFDGFDIDWEGSTSAETANYTGLLQGGPEVGYLRSGPHFRRAAPHLLVAADGYHQVFADRSRNELAREAFAAVAAQDPACGMARWGVAMTYFHPIWAPPTPVELAAGRAAAIPRATVYVA